MSRAEMLVPVLELAWVAWLPAVLVLLVRTLRSARPRERRALGILLVATVVPIIAVFALPFRIDASGVMELFNDPLLPAHWKGMTGKALVGLVRPLGVDHGGVIVGARLFLLLAVGLAAALLLRSAPRSATSAPAAPGADAPPLILGPLVLLGLPSFTFGILAVHNFWFYSPLVLGALLALEEPADRPSITAGVVLVAGIVLLGLARPESIVGGLVLALVVVGRGVRRRRPWLVAGAAAAALALVVTAPAVFEFLFQRMRAEPLLMGSDVAGVAPAARVSLVGLKRILAHVPVNAVCLLVALHAVLVLAIARGVRIVRARAASWPELAALGLLLVELIAVGIHREGFSRVAKYVQLVTAPAWYLAFCGAWPDLAAPRRRAWRRGLVIATAAFLVLYVIVELGDIGRNGLKPERSWSARQADPRLLWREVPAVGRRCCRAAGAQARVLVIGLDERRAGQQNLGDYLGIEGAAWESDRSPIVHQLRRDGCAVSAVYPAAPLAITELLAPGAGPGLLERPVDFGGGALRPPTLALATFEDPRRRAELAAALPPGWRIEEELGAALLLGRAAAPRPAE